MKQKILLAACLALAGMLGARAQVSMIALHHQGKPTFFTTSQAAKALAAAVDGDTLYFSTGVFTGDITITKKITLIGTGMDTEIRGNVSIAIPDSVTLTSRLLQNLRVVNGYITVDKPVAGLKISQCRGGIRFNASIRESTIDRSSTSLLLSNKVKGLRVVSCKIYLEGDCSKPEDAEFVNCNFQMIYGSLATFVNCVIWQGDGKDDTIFKNCLWNSNTYNNSGIQVDCWYTRMGYSEDLDYTFSTDDYKGTDGTVVGIMGGALPFTLAPAVPHVTEHKIEVDELGQQLKVTLKLGSE